MSEFLPEKLRELISHLERCNYVSEQNEAITEWMSQNSPAARAVGLSEGQIDQFGDYYGYGTVLRNQLRVWMSKQEFDIRPEDKYEELYWKEAPSDAVLARVVVEYLREDGYTSAHNNKILAQIERPKPLIEVGQTWRCISNQLTYRISGITTLEGMFKEADIGWSENVQLIAYQPFKPRELKTYNRTTRDFLAKFEPAQP